MNYIMINKIKYKTKNKIIFLLIMEIILLHNPKLFLEMVNFIKMNKNSVIKIINLNNDYIKLFL